jgi:PKHD-type hydroxylase
VILEYNYWFFKAAIPATICDQIVEMGITSMLEQQAKYGESVTNGTTGGWKQKTDESAVPINSSSVAALKKKKQDYDSAYVRDSNVTFLSNPELYNLVWPFVHEANKNAKWNFDWDYTEDFQFTKYGPGQFYGWHTDSTPFPYRQFDPTVDNVRKNPDGTDYIDMYGATLPEDLNTTGNSKLVGKIRKLSVTLSLNDPKEYSGGNLRFDLGPHRTDRYHTCTEIRPKGSIVVFPSHIHHQVTPVTRGTRYSLVSWHLGLPFK